MSSVGTPAKVHSTVVLPGVANVAGNTPGARQRDSTGFGEMEGGLISRGDRNLRVPLHAGTLGVPLGGTRRVGGLLGVAGTLSGMLSFSL